MTQPTEALALALRMGERLDAAGLPYMVVGSVAAAIHGYFRTTMDLDVVVARSPAGVRRFVASLDPEDHYVDLEAALEALRRGSQFNVIEFESGWKVDFIALPDTEFDREQLADAQRVEAGGSTVQVARAEATIVAKLRWAQSSGSARQLEDVTRLYELLRPGLDVELLRRWGQLAGVAAELEAVLAE